ncbi:MAG: DUF2752 domain-containing protein [Mediterranea sp.]|jgi:hypothetical protein|nr:DUF2752 domain-containing protein [Mediterranea sp.]
MHRRTKYLKFIVGIAIVLSIALLVWLYKTYNPVGHALFPKCPFKLLTGFECPGCGSQRTIHYLLNGQIGNAIAANALLVLSIPYLLIAILLYYIPKRTPWLLRLRNLLYGERAIWVVLVVILLFWIGRNLV